MDDISYRTRRRTTLADYLARLQERIAALQTDPARSAALRAAEIERDHIARELGELSRK
jgi:hypothetical protein